MSWRMQFYSYPQFFFDQWKELMLKEDEERRRLRAERKKLKKKGVRAHHTHSVPCLLPSPYLWS